MSSAAVSLPRRFASLVKLEHTVFALPFAPWGCCSASARCRPRATGSGSPWRWSGHGRWRWAWARLIDAGSTRAAPAPRRASCRRGRSLARRS